MKKFLSVFLAIVLLCCICPFNLSANASTTLSDMKERAEAIVNYQWTPSQDINTWNNNLYNGRTYFKKGETVTGVPYTLFTTEVVSFSLLSLSQYKSKASSNYSASAYCVSTGSNRTGPVYGSCCADFVCEVFGENFMIGSNMRYHNVSGIKSSSYGTTTYNVKASAIKAGDAVSNTSGTHIVWMGEVTDSYFLIYEQTPPVAKKTKVYKSSAVNSNGYLVYGGSVYNIVTKSNSLSSTSPCNCSTSYAGEYKCTTSSLNLTIRSGHGSSYSAIGSIPPGATVSVSKADGSWAHVTYNGVSGYASMEYLSKPHTHSYTGQRLYQPEHPHAISQRCVDYDSCGGYIWTGEYYTDNTCSQCWNATLSSSINPISLNLNGTKTRTATISVSGCYPGACGVRYDIANPEIVSASWGEWNGDTVPITVTGKKLGNTTLTISLYENYSGNKNIIATKTIPINVTISSTDISSNSICATTISTGGEMKYFTFTPTTSGTYVIYSTGSADTKVYLYNSSGTEITNNDDGGENRNFRLQYDLTAGTTYLFGVKYYNSSKTGTISFKFGNVYTISYNANSGSGVPSAQTKDYGTDITLSSTVPTRPGYTFLGWATSPTATTATYSAGGTYSVNSNATLYAVWKENPTIMTANSTYNATISTGGEMKYFTFTPTTSGNYVIYSTGSADTRVYLYNASGNAITSNDDGGEGRNFRLSDNLTAGTTYLFGIRYYSDTATGTIPFKFGKVYTISYNANGGSSAPASQTKDYGTELTLSSTVPAKTGYTFLGWATSSTATSATYSAGGTYSANSDVTLYAVWKANTYYVKYNANGGTGTMSNSTHTFGVKQALTANTYTRTGYTFLGWSKTKNATTASYVDGKEVSGLTGVDGRIVNLYAVWQPINYSVKYNANGGKGTMENSEHTFGVAQALTANTFTRTGYTFLGWAKTKNATTASYVDGKEVSGLTGVQGKVVDLYAVWKPNNYTVKYHANGGTGTMAASSFTYGVAQKLRANSFTRTGYIFKGWKRSTSATTAMYTDAQSVKNLLSKPNNTLTLYAVWEPINYSVKYNANGGTGIMANSSHTFGTAKALSANKYTRTGYIFLGWSKDKNATTASYVDGKAVSGLTGVDGRVVNLYAVWQPINYSVKYNANGGTGTMANSSHTFGVSKALSANKFTRTGYIFLGWSKTKNATTATYTNKQAVSMLTGVQGKTVTLYAVWQKK